MSETRLPRAGRFAPGSRSGLHPPPGRRNLEASESHRWIRA